MKIKKVLAGVLACVTVSGALPYSNYIISENFAVTASAETYENLTYEKYSDHVEITDCDESATEVVIPHEIDGLPVTSIRSYAFDYCSNLTSITIPDSVTSIGSWAFHDTEWYNNQPDGVVYAGKVAYKYKGEMPENTEIILKNDTVSITSYAFSDCTGLKSITIPNSVTSIGVCAFEYCSSLESIIIPNSVTSINNNAFSGCSDLTSINVSENNKDYADLDGVLFNKDKTELISYPIGKIETEYTIPTSVTCIGYCAFASCTGLTSVTISESVTSIYPLAFYECTGLESVTILNPECDIDIESFYTSGFKTIYGYENSTAQAYAEKYKRNFVALDDKPADTIKGDVTDDGKVEIADIVVIASYVGDKKNNPLSSDAIVAGDVHNTGDGLTASDVLMIQQYIAGIIIEL